MDAISSTNSNASMHCGVPIPLASTSQRARSRSSGWSRMKYASYQGLRPWKQYQCRPVRSTRSPGGMMLVKRLAHVVEALGLRQRPCRSDKGRRLLKREGGAKDQDNQSEADRARRAAQVSIESRSETR